MDTWKVLYFKANNKNPVRSFLDTLSEKQQDKLLRIFSHIEEYGLSSVIPHIKRLSGYPLWEIRVLGKDNIRVIYAIPLSHSVLLLHGFTKKTQKTSAKDIEISLERLIIWRKMIDK